MATRKAVHPRAQAVDPPPKVWPFPTWKGQPYTPPKKPRVKKRKVSADWPEALF